MTLKVYANRISQPARAIIIFCKANGIDFEEVRVDLSQRQQLTPEFEEINPMKKVPAIVDGRFKLFESHAILFYLACVYPGVADHWYPADLILRAKIHSVLDWHHSNLRSGAAAYVLNSTLGPAFRMPLNPEAAAESENVLSASLRMIESFWLNGSGGFLLGSSQPSIADLSLVCEIMQLQLVDEKDRVRILGPYQRVMKWIDDTKNATRPYFEEVHSVLFKVKEEPKKLQYEGVVGETWKNAPCDLSQDVQHPNKNQKGQKNVWRVKEDVALMSSWIIVSEDKMRGKNQKGASLWARVHALYHRTQVENPDELNERNMDSIKGRWKRLNENGNKWIVACKEAYARKGSGMNYKDIEKEAHAIYEEGGSKFQDLFVFNEVMSKHSKWDLTLLHNETHLRCEDEDGNDQESGGTKRSKISQDGEHSIPSNPETPTTNDGEYSIRPTSRDKIKKKGKGKASQSESNDAAAEIRTLRLAINNEVELMRSLSSARIDLEREKLQRNSMKMKEKMLNTLLGKDHLCQEDEEVKRRLIAIVFG